MRGSRGGRRGRGRGRGRGGRGRGRGKKSTKVIESDDEEMPLQCGEEATEENDENQQPSSKQTTEEWPEQQQRSVDMEADISLLEAPTFTTINRGPPEPMLRLSWDHRVNLMGEKVLNPMIHCCDQCNKPILIYGRMIPCKHVFCLKCAKQEEKICPRCNDKVLRVEQAGLGTVFMCVHGGTRYGNVGCRRTYLSQRDLQAHINHRHTVQSADTNNSQFPSHIKEAAATPSPVGKMLPTSTPSTHSSHHQVSHVSSHGVPHSSGSSQRIKSEPRPSEVNHHRSRGGPSPPPPPPPPYAPMQHRPPMMVAPGYPPTAPPPQTSMRTNLITVPIQDVEIPPTTYHHHYTQPPPPQYTHAAYAVPPPQQAPQYYPPVTYATGVQPQYVQGVQVVGQGVPQVQVPQVQQGVPQGMSVRPPQYPDQQYRPPPTVSHGQQWQMTSSNPPPTFYR